MTHRIPSDVSCNRISQDVDCETRSTMKHTRDVHDHITRTPKFLFQKWPNPDRIIPEQPTAVSRVRVQREWYNLKSP